ncbi:MAG: Trk system potassium transporter TrkA [Armatimonadota bacterium]|nr:Trk system potassium transporter TrkA [Armatimonadota bacterium]MDR5697638.1 Trk system potassium transporter TrkA [Armatimonadota bacterium]
MYVVLAGAGLVGSQIAKALESQHDVVVIDLRPEVRDRLATLDVRVLVGQATDPEVLTEAKVDRADAFIACTDRDEVNLIVSMLAKGLGARQVLCFVGRASYAEILTDPRAAEVLGHRIDKVIWAQRSVAEEIIEIVQVPGALDMETLAGGRLRFVEYRIAAGGVFAQQPLAGQQWPEGVHLAGILRGRTFLAREDEGLAQIVLEPGDRLLFATTPLGFTALQACFAPRGRVRRIMVVGGGSVGYMVARELVKHKLEITIVERDARRCEFLSEHLSSAWVLHGDGTDLDLLTEEGLSRSDVLVAVTDNDEKNLLVSLLAKQMGVPKVITRVGRPEHQQLFEQVGIDVPVTPTVSAVRQVVDWLAPEVGHVPVLEETLDLIEVELPKRYRRMPLSGLNLPRGATVVAVLNGQRASLPGPSTTVEGGDHLLILAPREIENEVLRRLA